jgi:hypothetical protein
MDCFRKLATVVGSELFVARYFVSPLHLADCSANARPPGLNTH